MRLNFSIAIIFLGLLVTYPGYAAQNGLNSLLDKKDIAAFKKEFEEKPVTAPTEIKELLSYAAGLGSVEAVKFLISKGADPKNDSTPLVNAAQFGYADVVEYLLSVGADPNKPYYKELTPWSSTVSNFSIMVSKVGLANAKRTVDLLIKEGARINAQDKEGNTVLYQALHGDDRYDLVPYLIEKGVDPNLTNKGGEAAIDVVCRMNSMRGGERPKNISTYLFLVKHGAKPARGQVECLWSAIGSGNNEVVAELLKTQKIEPGMLALAANNDSKNEELPILLLAHGADASDIPIEGRHYANALPPLLAAAKNGLPNLTEALLKAGASPKMTDEYQLTALHYALQGPQDMRPSDGPPPDWSLISNYIKVAQFLLEACADRNAIDSYKKTPENYLEDVVNAEFKKRMITALNNAKLCSR